MEEERMKNTLLILMVGIATLETQNPTLAGGEGGWGSGGGSAIVCYFEHARKHIPSTFVGDLPPEALNPANIESITQYDLFYARKKEESANRFREMRALVDGGTLGLFEVVRPEEGETIKNYFQRVLKTVSALIPRLGEVINEGHRSFDIVDKKKGIPPLSDFTDHLKEDRSDLCLVLQMARQRTLGNVHELDIDSRFFFHAKHPLESQATVFLHEDVYLYGRTKLGQRSADATHVLVAQLLNKQMEWDRVLPALELFRFTYKDTAPYAYTQKRLADLRAAYETVNQLVKQEVKECVKHLGSHPFAKAGPPTNYPLPVMLGKLENVKDGLKNEIGDAPLYDLFRLLVTANQLEAVIAAPLQVESLGKMSIQIFKEKGRRDLRREEEKKVENARKFFGEMESQLTAYKPLVARLHGLVPYALALFEEKIRIERTMPFVIEIPGLEGIIPEDLRVKVADAWAAFLTAEEARLAEIRKAWNAYHSNPSLTPTADAFRKNETIAKSMDEALSNYHEAITLSRSQEEVIKKMPYLTPTTELEKISVEMTKSR